MNDFDKSKYVSIGSDRLLRFGLGMSKIGSQFSSSLEHIKGRLSVLDCASEYGKIFSLLIPRQRSYFCIALQMVLGAPVFELMPVELYQTGTFE